MAFGDTGTMSIKKHCEGASQLDHGDARVVSVVLEHGEQPITGRNKHDGSMFWRCDASEPQRVDQGGRRLRRRGFGFQGWVSRGYMGREGRRWSRGIMVVTRRDGVEAGAAASEQAPPTVQASRMREQARPSLQAKRDQTGKVRKGGACLVLAWSCLGAAAASTTHSCHVRVRYRACMRGSIQEQR
jgi:hypothetical protein